MSQFHYIALFALAAACAMPSTAQSQDFRRIPAPDHDPLYIDQSSIRRTGQTVRFSYALDVPIAFRAMEKRQWRSNEMDTVIDCVEKTYIIHSVQAHSGPAATGNLVGSYTSRAEELKPARIVQKSTFDHLANYVCRMH